MKVKNEYVKICIGKNKFTFKNIILDKYLEKLAKNQISNIGTGKSLTLDTCYLKFDRKLIFDESTELHIKDFNSKCIGNITHQENNSEEISTTYLYNTSNIKQYIDKEITAIGFFEDGIDECYACLNTYGLGLTITDYFDFYIERKDTIRIDAEFTNHAIVNGNPISSNIDKILHLTPGEQTVDGEVVENVYLTNILFGDEENILLPFYVLSIDENKLQDGIIESTNTFSYDSQHTYVWFIYTATIIDNNSTLNKAYFLKKPIENFENFKISIKYERSNS